MAESGQCRGLPRLLVRGNDVNVGSDSRQCLVEIQGASACHATLSYGRASDSESGWILLARAPGVLLNGREVAPGVAEPLCNGDGIVIAGLPLRYDAEILRLDRGETAGLSLEVRNLTEERAGRTLLRDVSFSVGAGQFLGILGPSGCGKTTLIQRIAGLASFSEGAILFNGHSAADPETRARLGRLVAYLPQNVEDTLHDMLTVSEEMAYARRIYLAGSPSDAELDLAGLEIMGLEGEASTRVGKLSGGQKRRLAIALALQREPRMLLFDEPTAGLDPAVEREVMGYLRRLANQGHTVICTTHAVENLRLFDSVLALSGGRENGIALFHGAPADLLGAFGVESISELYGLLRSSERGLSPLLPFSVGETEAWPLPEVPKRASFFRTACGYFSRRMREIRNGVFGSATLAGRILPVPLRGLVLVPFLMTLAVKCACAAMHGETDTFITRRGGGISTVFFCAALSVFWLGITSMAQELVKEREPGRCLDRLGGIGGASYFASKLLYMVASSLLMTAIFTAFFLAVPPLGSEVAENYVQCSSAADILKVGATLFAVCLAGGGWGMLVSAISRKSTEAVMAIPAVAIMALFFSQPVIGFEAAGDFAAFTAPWFAKLMPCYYPQLYMTGLMKGGGGLESILPKLDVLPCLVLLLLSMTCFTLAVAFIFQRIRERSWEGR